MVGCITIAHGIAQRLSEKWRHFACTSDIITFCMSGTVVWLHFILVTALSEAPASRGGEVVSGRHFY